MLKKLLVKFRDQLFLNAVKRAIHEELSSYTNNTQNIFNNMSQKIDESISPFTESLEALSRKNDDFRRLYEKTSLTTMPPASGGLRKIQKESYELLKFLKQTCEENNLTFWIQGGTLLGAKRHQGFIPWDDDIDCGMIRNDLEKLREIIKENDTYEIIDAYHFVPKDNFACRMPKLVQKGKNYIFIDIFPYDYVQSQNTEHEWDLFMQKKNELTNELCAMNFANPDCPIKDTALLEKSKSIIDKYIPLQIRKDDATHILWGIENLISHFPRLYTLETILPCKTLLFEDDLFPVPNRYDEYLFRQYGDIWRLPNDYRKLCHFEFYINEKEKLTSLENKVIGYTAGAFDLFHIGHLNLLRRAKEHCDYLIVGVSSDDLVSATKGKRPFIPLQERIEILKSIDFVDEVVVQEDLDKFTAWEKYHYDILFSGDDWKGNKRWKEYETKLSSVGVKVQFFEYTKTTSSSQIQEIIKNAIHAL